MVETQHQLVTDGLGVKTLRLLLGTSMGGMQAWMWAEQYPDAMQAVLPIACVPGPVKGRNLLWRRLLGNAISADPGCHGGAYDTQPVALRAAWNLFELMAGSAEHFEKDPADIPAADAKIKNSNETALAGQDANPHRLHVRPTPGRADPNGPTPRPAPRAQSLSRGPSRAAGSL